MPEPGCSFGRGSMQAQHWDLVTNLEEVRGYQHWHAIADGQHWWLPPGSSRLCILQQP